jgi:hypothetical protein
MAIPIRLYYNLSPSSDAVLAPLGVTGKSLDDYHEGLIDLYASAR